MSTPGRNPTDPEAAAPRASILIPSAAAREILFACLESLAKHAAGRIPTEVILVLDVGLASAEPELRRRFPRIRILTPGLRLGLAAAANRARAAARGEFLVLLHDDTEVEPGWLEGLVTEADEHPEAGAIGSLVLELDGRLQSAGSILWRDGWTSPPWTGERPSPSQFAESRAVDYCGTSSLLVRAATWDAVGGLDEEFHPLYYVDVDLAMAVRRLGESVRLEPRSRVRHHRGASTQPGFRKFLLDRNQRRFLDKWRQEMGQFDPPGRESPDAIARSLARAESVPAVPRERQPASPLPPFDAEAQERRQRALAAQLELDWTRELARLAAD